ncbi:MAG: phosphoenolpyruvate--protein phosphotransferase [Rhodothermales bacterium]|nr:phosphoenolpyruvate--protein phosphotransferase [Rhodothermales bacterium]
MKQETVLTGIPISPGFAIGKAYSYSGYTYEIDDSSLDTDSVDAELDRFEEAIVRSERDLRKIITVAREKLGDESADIFDAQLLMLRDPSLYDAVREIVQTDMRRADYVVDHVINGLATRMEASKSEYLKDRASDFHDVRDRIVRHLRRDKLLSAVRHGSIIVAENLTAADIVLFSRRDIIGAAIDFGGATSHVAIMARALRVPSVFGLHGGAARIESGTRIVVDGVKGRLIVNPTQETVDRYKKLRKRYDQLIDERQQFVSLPSETIDGRKVTLRANFEFREELDLIRENGADGIGLFRTEVMHLMQGRMSISEDEQFRTYKHVVETLEDQITTIRVLDLGGDKLLPMAHREHNPFLGWRGIRVLLDKPEILEPHLRAILRASAFGPVRILVPMVSDTSELEEFLQVLDRQKALLRKRGIAFSDSIPVGTMIEVPAAALMAGAISDMVDFVSIGSNDLTQYVLAVDRGNDLVAEKYQELHPAVLKLIKLTIDEAHNAGISASLCGEMGAESRNLPILVGLGIDEISASPTFIPELKRFVRAIDSRDARQLAESVLQAKNTVEVNTVLEEWLTEHPFDLAHLLEADELSAPTD